MKQLKYIPLAIILGLLCIISIGLLRAAVVLYAISPKPDPLPIRIYTRIFSERTAITDLSIPGSAGPIHLRLYTPKGVKDPPTICLVHGFVEQGDQHPILNRLALRLTRVGFRVVAPTIPAETQFEMRASDLAVIGDTILWSAKTYNTRITVMGISFGGGLAITAASQPAIAPHVKLLFAVSSYDDLERIDHYYIHERVYGPDGQPFPGKGPTTGPILFLSQYIDEIVSPKDVIAFRPIIKRLKDNVGNPHPIDDDTDLARLSPEQRTLFADLQTVGTPQMRRICLAVLAGHKTEIERLSPSSVLPQLKIPLYAMHGTYDTSLPPSEFAWTVHDSADNPNAHFLLTPWLNHANIGGHATIFDKIQAGIFFARFLDAAKRP